MKVLSWDEYFMSIAKLSALRSKDPNTQVGACIVNKQKRIVGIGYNGFPSGTSDGDFSWEREADNVLDTKYPYVVHAEVNAILNSRQNLEGCILYVSLFPCNECAKIIIQSGIKEVVYISDKYKGTNSFIASQKLFDKSNVKYRKIPNLNIAVDSE